VESSPQLNFDSVQKVSILAIGVALSCYSAVSPRTLPTAEYNMKFFENIKTVALAMIAPIFHFVFVFDPKENNVNRAVSFLLVGLILKCTSHLKLAFVASSGECPL
jgi:hypothetical protein